MDKESLQVETLKRKSHILANDGKFARSYSYQ